MTTLNVRNLFLSKKKFNTNRKRDLNLNWVFNCALPIVDQTQECKFKEVISKCQVLYHRLIQLVYTLRGCYFNSITKESAIDDIKAQ